MTFERKVDVLNGQRITEDLILLAQKGDQLAREEIIEHCMPWIKKMVRKHSFVFSVEQSDEFSIALQAFNDSIDRYKPERNIPFLGYSSVIIRNRLIDWNRHRSGQLKERSFSDMSFDRPDYESQIEDPRSSIVYEDIEAEDSLIEVEYQLSQYGLSLSQLSDNFPKQRKTLVFCAKIARILSEDIDLYQKGLTSGRLPVSALSEKSGEKTKMIDKHRSCIICLAVLLKSDLLLIRSYIAILEKEART